MSSLVAPGGSELAIINAEAGPSRPSRSPRPPSNRGQRRPRSFSSPAEAHTATGPSSAAPALSPPPASLAPILSRISTRKAGPPPRDDGFDNYPAPLPSDPVQLERILTEHPEVEGQMAMDEVDIGPPPDGGREAWCVVASTVFILFCVHGLGEFALSGRSIFVRDLAGIHRTSPN